MKIQSYGFVYSRTSFCMPTFNGTIKSLTCLEDAIVIVLIVNWSSYAVAKHTFGNWCKRVDRVLGKKFCC